MRLARNGCNQSLRARRAVTHSRSRGGACKGPFALRRMAYFSVAKSEEALDFKNVRLYERLHQLDNSRAKIRTSS